MLKRKYPPPGQPTLFVDGVLQELAVREHRAVEQKGRLHRKHQQMVEVVLEQLSTHAQGRTVAIEHAVTRNEGGTHGDGYCAVHELTIAPIKMIPNINAS